MRGRGCEAGHLSASSLRIQKTPDIVPGVGEIRIAIMHPRQPSAFAWPFNTDFTLKAVSCVPLRVDCIGTFCLEITRRISQENLPGDFLQKSCLSQRCCAFNPSSNVPGRFCGKILNILPFERFSRTIIFVFFTANTNSICFMLCFLKFFRHAYLKDFALWEPRVCLKSPLKRPIDHDLIYLTFANYTNNVIASHEALEVGSRKIKFAGWLYGQIKSSYDKAREIQRPVFVFVGHWYSLPYSGQLYFAPGGHLIRVIYHALSLIRATSITSQINRAIYPAYFPTFHHFRPTLLLSSFGSRTRSLISDL